MMRYEKLTKEHYHNIKPNAHLSREYHDTTSETINMIVNRRRHILQLLRHFHLTPPIGWEGSQSYLLFPK
jgi:hypothetical protein